MPGPRDHDDLLGADLLARLERWAADARVDDAAARRTRERWLRHQAEEDSTFHGVLVDLAERGVAVGVTTRAGRRFHGEVRAVGRDFCAVGARPGTVLLAVAALASVRTDARVAASCGASTLDVELTIAEVLAELATEREQVQLRTGGDDPVSGRLRSVGRDVVTLRVDGEPPSTAYVRIEAITELALA